MQIWHTQDLLHTLAPREHSTQCLIRQDIANRVPLHDHGELKKHSPRQLFSKRADELIPVPLRALLCTGKRTRRLPDPAVAAGEIVVYQTDSLHLPAGARLLNRPLDVGKAGQVGDPDEVAGVLGGAYEI